MGEQMLELRKRKEEEVFKEKQATRQKMIDGQARNLMQMASNEEARLEKQVREKERAEESETAAFLSEWCKTLDKQEQDEQDLKRMAAKKLSIEHKQQVEIQRRRHEETKG